MKRIVSAAIAATFLLAAPTQAATTFTDLANYDVTTQQAVTYLVDKKIVNGTSPTTFTPQRDIKRSQVVKMLGRYLETTGKIVPSDWQTNARFRDVPVTTPDEELLKYAALVYDEGVFIGNAGKLNPSGTLSRENLVLVLSRLAAPYELETYAKEHGLTANVLDLDFVKEESKTAVELFNALGISNVAIFNPKGDVKRVHFASFLAKMLQLIDRLQQEDEIVTPIKPPIDIPEPLPETPQLPVPIVPSPVEPDDELEETFIVEDGVLEHVEVLNVSAEAVTVKHASIGTATFAIDGIYEELFASSEPWEDAVATFTIEEDVITDISALTIKQKGSAQKPVQLNGVLFDGITELRVESQYANFVQFEDYYEIVTIDAPGEAHYTLSGGEFETIRAAGPLHVTFTGIISNDLVLDAPAVNVTVAETADIYSIAPTNELTLSVNDGGVVYDVYMPAHIEKATVHGYIDTMTLETIKPFSLYGTAQIETLYGNASAIYVEEDGVSVLDVLLSSDVEDVTIR